MMFSMGLSLTIADFKRIANYPKAAILGVMMQLMLLPLLAWGLILFADSLFSLPMSLAMGLLILAACPGGATSNVIAHLAGGDGALSISMTAVVSLIVPFLVPVTLLFQFSWLGAEAKAFQLPIMKTIMQLLIVTVIPVILAMLLRHYFSLKVQAVEPSFRKLTGIMFIALVISLTLAQWQKLSLLGLEVIILCLALCLLSMSIAYLIANKLGLDKKTEKTLSIEVGIQNAGTGIFIAAVLMGNPELALIPLMYGLLMNIPAVILIGMNQSAKVMDS
jgi:BASS family bile acid:Na+ symporter